MPATTSASGPAIGRCGLVMRARTRFSATSEPNWIATSTSAALARSSPDWTRNARADFAFAAPSTALAWMSRRSPSTASRAWPTATSCPCGVRRMPSTTSCIPSEDPQRLTSSRKRCSPYANMPSTFMPVFGSAPFSAAADERQESAITKAGSIPTSCEAAKTFSTTSRPTWIDSERRSGRNT